MRLGAGSATTLKHAWAHALSDGLDRSALAGRVAAFEQNDDSRFRFFDPNLQVAKLDLQLLELSVVSFAFHFGFGIAAARSF